MKLIHSLLIFIILVLGSFFLAPSCKHEISITGQYDTVCFDTKIQPLIASKCGRCHGSNTGKNAHPTLLTFSQISKEVTPYNSAQSRLYQAITSLWENPMPPDSALSLEERLIIRIWIDQGALHTTCPVDTTHSKSTIPPDTATSWVNPYACYTRDIMPIFVSKCAMTGCHDGVTKRARLDMSTYASMMAYIGEGSAGIVPYNPNASVIYQAITGGEDIMPPVNKNIPLTQTQIDTIYRWISRGAKDTVCGQVCDTTNVTFSGKVWPIIQNACSGCHSGTSPALGISLTSYAQVDAIVTDGRLIKAIRRTLSFPMPPSYTLPYCNERTIEIWVNAGAPNN
jgi:Planctomycete cytochrome C